MQSPSWYIHRLMSMSAGEIAWRVRSSARDLVDRPRFALGLVPSEKSSGATTEFSPAFRLSDVAIGAWTSSAEKQAWLSSLRAEADDILAHRLTFFDLERKDFGDPIQWNRDISAGIDSSMGFAPGVDYRDFARNGDCKLVWEPSRHHQFVALARAYRATGDIRYAEGLRAQWRSWLDACPFGRGMNWRSPLEFAIRILNWAWAYDLAYESGIFAGDFGARVRHSTYLHIWEITRRYSQASSANNHTIGEAAGVYLAASYFHTLNGAATMRADAKRILEREIIAQTHPDGVNCEQAFSYHCFVLQFFLLCGLIGRKNNDEFSAGYLKRIERMLTYLADICAGGEPPMYGDCDDARVLGLGGDHKDTATLLALGASLFGRADWKAIAGGWTEPAHWLLGDSGHAKFSRLPATPVKLESKAFPDAGIFLLQSGSLSDPDRLSLVFDCGELGFGAIAAHGHADALSLTLRIGGEHVLVDPGTYDYFTYPEWRNHFRSTRAHNTVEIDGQDQSVMLGKFLWGDRARAQLGSFDGEHGKVIGSHDGYSRLPGNVIHRRDVALAAAAKAITIVDRLTGVGEHTARAHFHFAPGCTVSISGHSAEVVTPKGTRLGLRFDSRLQLATQCGSESPISGWYSDGYHRRMPAPTLIASAIWSGEFEFRTECSVHAAAQPGEFPTLASTAKC